MVWCVIGYVVLSKIGADSIEEALRELVQDALFGADPSDECFVGVGDVGTEAREFSVTVTMIVWDWKVLVVVRCA